MFAEWNSVHLCLYNGLSRNAQRRVFVDCATLRFNDIQNISDRNKRMTCSPHKWVNWFRGKQHCHLDRLCMVIKHILVTTVPACFTQDPFSKDLDILIYFFEFNEKPLQVMELKGDIIVYSIEGCPHCIETKNSLQELNLPYIDVSLARFPHCRDYVKQRTGKQTAPQIFFNNIHVGGNEEFQNVVSFQ